MTCSAACWTPVDCTLCGKRKAPSGRSVPLAMANGYCDNDCAGYHQDPKPPHLWSEHDSTRHYTDPEGWAEHEKACPVCRPDCDECNDLGIGGAKGK